VLGLEYLSYKWIRSSIVLCVLIGMMTMMSVQNAAYCVCGECVLLTDRQWNEIPLRNHPCSPLYSAYMIEPVQLASTVRKSSWMAMPSTTTESTVEETTSSSPLPSSSPIVCSLFYGILRDRSGPVYIRHDSRKYEKMFRYKCPHCELMIAYSQDPNRLTPLFLMTSMVRLEGDGKTISVQEKESINKGDDEGPPSHYENDA
jgi:hypothetical protein